MARIDKKFITNCIEKYPEIKAHKDLFGFEVSDIRKVLADGYSYTPADPNPIVIIDKELFVDIYGHDTMFDSFHENFSQIENDLKKEITNEYGIIDFSEVSKLNISAQEDKIVCSFDRKRTETKVELAERMVQDAEDKSLFGISSSIKFEYDALLQAAIRAEEEKDRRRIQAEIAVLEKRKKELEGQMKK